MQSEKDREALAVERLNNEIAELRQEIALLKEAQQSILQTRQVCGSSRLFVSAWDGFTLADCLCCWMRNLQSSSAKAQYEEEKQEIEEEIAHVSSKLSSHAFKCFCLTLWLVLDSYLRAENQIESVLEDTTTQLNSNGVRLHSLLRTLAPSPSVGTLMTRLHQQLSQEGSTTAAEAGGAKAIRKTVDLQAFLSVRSDDRVCAFMLYIRHCVYVCYASVHSPNAERSSNIVV